MKTVLERTGTGKVTNSFLPQAIYANNAASQEEITNMIITISIDNSEDLENQEITMTIPRNEYYLSFKVGDEVSFEEYFTPTSYNAYVEECNKLDKPVKTQEEFEEMHYGEFTYEIQPLVK